MALAHVPQSHPLTLLSDSQYVVRMINEWIPKWKRSGWKIGTGKPVANLKLVQKLDGLVLARQPHLKVEWVKGHAGTRGNEEADRAAVAAAYAERGRKPIPQGTGWVWPPKRKPAKTAASERNTNSRAVSRGVSGQPTRSASHDKGKTAASVRSDGAMMGMRPDAGLSVTKCSSCGMTLHPLSLDCRCTR